MPPRPGGLAAPRPVLPEGAAGGDAAARELSARVWGLCRDPAVRRGVHARLRARAAAAGGGAASPPPPEALRLVPLEAATQVVAGTNFFVRCAVGGGAAAAAGEQAFLRVWRRLDGGLEVAAVQLGVPASAPLEYFDADDADAETPDG